MNRNILRSVLLLLLIVGISPNRAKAQDQSNQVILPAGTLLRCTLNEPNFSSKTAEVGDPVVCPLGGVLLFDRAAFPRGAYLGGHLEAAKEPGRFFGKGYLRLEFDRIGLPDAVLPVPAKLIAASGYKVNRQGKIIGHGHPTRDTVEWMLPPLWPVKVLTLPERGPRPALKGEERLTLRLMDDVAIPTDSPSGWHSFGRSSLEGWPRWNHAAPSRYVAPHLPPPPKTFMANNAQVPAASKVSYSSPASPSGETQYLLALRNGTSFVATALRLNGDVLDYKLADGGSGLVSLDDVDWTQTLQSNAENGVGLSLTSENAVH